MQCTYIHRYFGGGGGGEGGVWGGPMPFPVLTLTPGLVPRLILTALSLGIGNETSVFNYESLIYNSKHLLKVIFNS